MKSLLTSILFICSICFPSVVFPEGLIWRAGLLTAKEPVLTVQVEIPEEIKQWIQEGIKHEKDFSDKNLYRGEESLSLELTLGPRKDAQGSLFRIFLDYPEPKTLTLERAVKDQLHYVNTFSFFEGEDQMKIGKKIHINLGPRIFAARKREQWLKNGRVPIQVVLKHRDSKVSFVGQHPEVPIESVRLVLLKKTPLERK